MDALVNYPLRPVIQWSEKMQKTQKSEMVQCKSFGQMGPDVWPLHRVP